MNKTIEIADIPVSPGGWYMGSTWLTKKQVEDAEKRWFVASHAAGKLEPDFDHENNWIPHQCGGCRYMAARGDWGICWNMESNLDGHVVFEHGGCDKHSAYQEAVE